MTAATASTLVHRLALGIEPIDALRRTLPAFPVRVDLETAIPHIVDDDIVSSHPQRRRFRPGGLLRHPTGRHSLHYFPGAADTVTLRITAPGRQFIPRRIRVPLVTQAVAEALETAENPAYLAGRVKRPVLFPGAAYPLSRATGVRTSLRREGSEGPLRWAHLELRERTAPDRVRTLTRTRSDDRGEVLLPLPPWSVLANELAETVTLEVSVWAPPTPPSPAIPDVPQIDPLWDMPLEIVADAAQDDAVTSGRAPPQGFVENSAPTNLTFILGRMLGPRDVGEIVFAPP